MIPDPIRGPTPEPLYQNADEKHRADGDDDGPHNPLRPSVGDAEQRERKRYLAPRCCEDHKETGRAGDDPGSNNLARVDQGEVFGIAAAGRDGLQYNGHEYGDLLHAQPSALLTSRNLWNDTSNAPMMR